MRFYSLDLKERNSRSLLLFYCVLESLAESQIFSNDEAKLPSSFGVFILFINSGAASRKRKKLHVNYQPHGELYSIQ
jgi:hypothetical protein